MKKLGLIPLLITLSLLVINPCISSQNPLITDQFTADPSARVLNSKVYVYPSHDIPCGEGQGYIGFCMADYHVFSSENLTNWTDHGIILSQNDVEWVDSTSYSMWAPDCIEKDGKYYFFFPAFSNENPPRRRIGIAVSGSPEGPFIPQRSFIEGVKGIDPNPFIDKDGQAYLYWGSGDTLQMARLKDNMLELASAPEPILHLPIKFKEGPYMFKRNGIYYITFPHVANKTECLAYATGDNPMGPFKYQGVIMDESPIACWTNHHSILEYKNQWYLFYHHNDLSPEFDKNRSIRVDSLFFNSDGTIQKVIPTLRGVGITPAIGKIQIDRYSQINEKVDSVAFLDNDDRSKGWKITFAKPDATVRYNSVNFESPNIRKATIRAKSAYKGTIEIRTADKNNIRIAEIGITPKRHWRTYSTKLNKCPQGVKNLNIVLTEGENLYVDWISFE